MDAIVTLMATLVGAGIAFFGQWVFQRQQRRERVGELLLRQCSRLVALNDDFENRLWEERILHLKGRVKKWDLTSSRLAVANLRILSGDPRLDNALNRLHGAGVKLGAHWRIQHADDEELAKLLIDFRTARGEFLSTSRVVVRKTLGP
jgi:hypothetical protein